MKNVAFSYYIACQFHQYRYLASSIGVSLDSFSPPSFTHYISSCGSKKIFLLFAKFISINIIVHQFLFLLLLFSVFSLPWFFQLCLIKDNNFLMETRHFIKTLCTQEVLILKISSKKISFNTFSTSGNIILEMLKHFYRF